MAAVHVQPQREGIARSEAFAMRPRLRGELQVLARLARTTVTMLASLRVDMVYAVHAVAHQNVQVDRPRPVAQTSRLAPQIALDLLRSAAGGRRGSVGARTGSMLVSLLMGAPSFVV